MQRVEVALEQCGKGLGIVGRLEVVGGDPRYKTIRLLQQQGASGVKLNVNFGMNFTHAELVPPATERPRRGRDAPCSLCGRAGPGYRRPFECPEDELDGFSYLVHQKKPCLFTP